MSISYFKKFYKYFGVIFLLLSLYYIYSIIKELDLSFLWENHPLKSILYIGLGALFFFFITIIVAYAWGLSIEFLNGKKISERDVIRVYLQTSIAKYLPGNALHYIGRNLLGNSLGWDHSKIAISSAIEIFFSLIGSGILILIFLSTGLLQIPKNIQFELNSSGLFQYLNVFILIMAGLIIGLIVYVLYTKNNFKEILGNLFDTIKPMISPEFGFLFLKILSINTASFFFNGFLFYMICIQTLDLVLLPGDFFNIVCALMIAGFTGIFTPGIPGGIGVKESATVLLISAYGYENNMILLSSIILRITIIVGELIGYFFSLLLKSPE